MNLRRRGLRRTLCRDYGLHPIRDREEIKCLLPGLYLAWCRQYLQSWFDRYRHRPLFVWGVVTHPPVGYAIGCWDDLRRLSWRSWPPIPQQTEAPTMAQDNTAPPTPEKKAVLSLEERLADLRARGCIVDEPGDSFGPMSIIGVKAPPEEKETSTKMAR